MFEYLRKMWGTFVEYICKKVPKCYERRHYNDTD